MFSTAFMCKITQQKTCITHFANTSNDRGETYHYCSFVGMGIKPCPFLPHNKNEHAYAHRVNSFSSDSFFLNFRFREIFKEYQ